MREGRRRRGRCWFGGWRDGLGLVAVGVVVVVFVHARSGMPRGHGRWCVPTVDTAPRRATCRLRQRYTRSASAVQEVQQHNHHQGAATRAYPNDDDLGPPLGLHRIYRGWTSIAHRWADRPHPLVITLVSGRRAPWVIQHAVAHAAVITTIPTLTRS
jgi:hypothetical protein